jgi:hypothetical protein
MEALAWLLPLLEHQSLELVAVEVQLQAGLLQQVVLVVVVLGHQAQDLELLEQ